MANPEDIQQEQLNASKQQLAKQSAQNEVLSGVILELAASQAQQGEIEQRQIAREKKIRRRAFIFDRIGSHWDRITAKKAFVHATNLYEKDRIEQVAQADAGIATAKNTGMVIGSLEFIALDIRKLVNFMMGNKLQEEENRRELFALLKPKKEIKRDEFKEKKYKGFISKAIGFIGGLLFAFTAGVIEGLRAKLSEIFKPLKDRISKIFKPFTERLAKFFKPLTDKLKSGRALVIGAFNTMKDTLLRFGKTIGAKLKLLKTTLFGPGSKIGFAASIIKNFKEKFGAVSKGFKSTTAVLFKPIKSLMGMLNQFKPMFKKLGFIFGKLFIPLSMLWDFVTGFVKEFKTSEFDNMFMKILDSVLSGIGSVAGGFIGGILDLVKWGLSWVASKLGFDGLSEWLDSFSIKDMVKDGMSNLLDMLDMLFTDLIPALVAGLKNKAMNPFTAGAFQDGFNDRMYGTEGAEAGGGADSRFFELKDEQRAVSAKIAEEQARIDRSNAGENEYFGIEANGVSNSLDRIEELRAEKAILDKQIATRGELLKQAAIEKRANTTGAQMEAMQDDTLGAKAQSAAAKITSVVTDSSSKVNNSITKVSNIGQHFDRTNSLAIAQ